MSINRWLSVMRHVTTGEFSSKLRVSPANDPAVSIRNRSAIPIVEVQNSMVQPLFFQWFVHRSTNFHGFSCGFPWLFPGPRQVPKRSQKGPPMSTDGLRAPPRWWPTWWRSERGRALWAPPARPTPRQAERLLRRGSGGLDWGSNSHPKNVVDMSMYIYIYMCMYVCECIWMCIIMYIHCMYMYIFVYALYAPGKMYI